MSLAHSPCCKQSYAGFRDVRLIKRIPLALIKASGCRAEQQGGGSQLKKSQNVRRGRQPRGAHLGCRQVYVSAAARGGIQTTLNCWSERRKSPQKNDVTGKTSRFIKIYHNCSHVRRPQGPVVKATAVADGRKMHRFSVGRYLCTHSSEQLVQMGETFNLN